YPCGQPRPNASALNYVAGETVANSVIVKIGAGGSVCLFTPGTVHLIAHVTGYFPAGSDFQAVAPPRLSYTRQSVDSATVDGLFKGLGVLGAGSVMELPVAGRGGVPADASAVALNVTVTEAQGSGF